MESDEQLENNNKCHGKERKCKKEKKTLKMHKTSRNLYFILRAMESNLIKNGVIRSPEEDCGYKAKWGLKLGRWGRRGFYTNS